MSLPRVSSGIKLSGREAKVIVTDYKFGDASLVLYSTTSVLFAGKIGGRDVLFLYGNPLQTHETAIFVPAVPGRLSEDARVLYDELEAGVMTVTILEGLRGDSDHHRFGYAISDI